VWLGVDGQPCVAWGVVRGSAIYPLGDKVFILVDGWMDIIA